ncbi:brachyurin [Cochliomyia hominivorax]
MNFNIIMIISFIIVILMRKAKTGDRYMQSYADIRSSRSRSDSRVGPWGRFPKWPDREEDYIVDNWMRKCAKYNIPYNIKSYITGGVKADMDMFPYLVGLLLYQPPRIYQCGGTLITQRYVLTAAHCLYRSIEARVYVGSYIYADAKNAVSVYNVTSKDFIIHERYGRQEFNDDIALINLENTVNLSDKVKLITLAPSYMTQSFLQGEVVTSAGWGRISDNDTRLNDQLYYADTRIIGYEKCMCFYLPGLVSRRSHICADGSKGRGGCDGDSGGPLIYQHKGVIYQVGLTSFGSSGGCEIGFPTVYTRITNYLGWIARKTDIKIE